MRRSFVNPKGAVAAKVLISTAGHPEWDVQDVGVALTKQGSESPKTPSSTTYTTVPSSTSTGNGQGVVHVVTLDYDSP